MIDLRSADGIEVGGMNSERMRKESSGNERLAHVVCQSEGGFGMYVGM
jgi:hypothetical protein